jgi:hypothetical protein
MIPGWEHLDMDGYLEIRKLGMKPVGFVLSILWAWVWNGLDEVE